MNENIYLKCPIRGELKIKKYDAKGNYSEEYWRIELIKFLLDKGYQKVEIKVEYTVKIGNPERDRLIADVCVFKNDLVYIVGEVKKHKDSKSNAVEHQLKPATDLTKAEYSVYFDGSENELHYQGKIYPINKLPKRGHSWEQVGLKFSDLRKITEVSLLYDRLDQIMHNYGLSKEKRYAGLFQILIMKYYDEKFNKKDLSFQLFPNSKENFSRIKSLYQSAKSYYSAGNSIDFENELILNEIIVLNLVSYLQEYSFIKSDISIIQDFFMRFGKEFLKKDLSQYYTPLPIVKFISSILAIKPSQLVIDPAGGSADFLVGVLEKYKHSPQLSDYNNNLFY